MKKINTKYVLLSNLDPVVVPLPDFETKKSQQKYRLFTAKYDEIEGHLKDDTLVILLGTEVKRDSGEDEEEVWFAMDASEVEDLSKLHAHAETLGVLPGLMMLREREAGIVAQARAMMAWHDR